MSSSYVLGFLILYSFGSVVLAGDYGGSKSSAGGSGSAVGQTQERRSSERFNILDFIRSQQASVNAQNAKYGRGSGGHGPYPDLNLTYEQNSGPVTRDGAPVGKDFRAQGRIQFLFDDLMTKGDRKTLLNIDLGVEGFLAQTTSFQADATSTQVSHSYSETGGGLIIRPFGRSSQDTGLLVKGGYVGFSETGLWNNNQSQISLYAPYVGAEAKIYLLNFLGLRAEYQTAFETAASALQAKWKMQKFTYGAFLEISLVNIEAHLISSEFVLTPNSTSAPSKETYSGVGFSGSVFF